MLNFIKLHPGVFEKIAIADAIAELADVVGDRVGDLDFIQRIVNIIL